MVKPISLLRWEDIDIMFIDFKNKIKNHFLYIIEDQQKNEEDNNNSNKLI